MKIIGITGGIGSGKSTVTQFLREKGHHVVDADLIAREIVAPGTEVLAELVSHFGSAILQNDGSLDRKKLAELAFASPEETKQLDRITHHAIISTVQNRIDKLQKEQNPPIIFVDAALLIETGLYKSVDEVWLVTAHEALRIKRVAARDMTDVKSVKQRIRMQMTDEQKMRHAYRIINNSGTKKELYQLLDKILRNYETV